MDELANTIEAGLRAGEAASAGENFEMGHAQLIDPAITDALAALADYRKRVQALEAENKRQHTLLELVLINAPYDEPKDIKNPKLLLAQVWAFWEARQRILLDRAVKTSALLAGSEGGE